MGVEANEGGTYECTATNLVGTNSAETNVRIQCECVHVKVCVYYVLAYIQCVLLLYMIMYVCMYVCMYMYVCYVPMFLCPITFSCASLSCHHVKHVTYMYML